MSEPYDPYSNWHFRSMRDVDMNAACECGHDFGHHAARPPGHCMTQCECEKFSAAAPVVIAHPHETMNGVTILAAAPLSTLPERPSTELTPEQVEAVREWVSDERCRLPSRQTTHKLCDTIVALRSRLSSLERELDGVRKDTERLDFLDDRTHLYETPVLDCYAGDQYEVTIGDAKDPLIGNGTSLREAIDAAMSALRERSE